MEYIYLDNAATTKVDPRIAEIVGEYMTEKFGNPSSLHELGGEGRVAIEEAREKVARLIGAEADEIIFTSGGTESDNLAIKGMLDEHEGRHIITTQIEHPSVFEPCKQLEREGYDVTFLPVDENGRVDPKDFEDSIRDDTVLSSIMYANNEIGTIEPIEELAKVADKNEIPFHTDAVQAVGKVPIDVKKERIDLLSISGHKIHAPKGVGALYVSKDIQLEPLLHGGGHERGYRSGTENVPGIVGLGKACEICMDEMDEYIPRMEDLRNRLIDDIIESVEEAYLNGHRKKRLSNNVNLSFKAVEGESLVLQLDSKGIAASTGSACSSKKLEPSRVIMAIGWPEEEAHSSLRLTLSRETTEEQIERAIDVIPSVVEHLRDMSPLWEG